MNQDDIFTSTSATVPKTVAARALGCDVRTLNHGIESGLIKHLKLGRRVLILRIPLVELLSGKGDK